MGRNTVPVVIVRKDKRLSRWMHLLAFTLTGGASAPVTAAKAATNVRYNARTRQLAAEADGTSTPPRRGRHGKVTLTDEERAYMAAHVPSSAGTPRPGRRG